jgi:hypothetical protein
VIYCSFGGTAKGLHFNNLIVGLVLLTRGRDEEKAKCKYFHYLKKVIVSHVCAENFTSKFKLVFLQRCASEALRMVAYFCNFCNSGGRDWKDLSLRPDQEKN